MEAGRRPPLTPTTTIPAPGPAPMPATPPPTPSARCGWPTTGPGTTATAASRLGRYHVCRRCLALHPLSLAVALASVAGHPPWPGRFDPGIVWLLSLPATAAYMAEALGWIRYRPWVQVATMLVAALAFGRALGYELLDRWQPVFWGPIAVFGGLWFFATVIGMRTRPTSPPAR